MRYPIALLVASLLVSLSNIAVWSGEERAVLAQVLPDATNEADLAERKVEADRVLDQGLQQAQVSQFRAAIQSWEQALEIYREIGDRVSEGRALGNLGLAYTYLGQYQQAIDFHEQALVITREIGDRYFEGRTLGNLGWAYQNLGQYQQALEGYQQGLTIAQEIGDPLAEGHWLSSIGALLAQQGQPEMAIVFYKQFVNVQEAIRENIRGLPIEQQQSFASTIADDYQELADLLLQQDRILEAQRVLDLLKVQELDDYLQSVRSNPQTQSGIDLADPEIQISDRTILVGRKLADLQAIPFTELSEGQLDELATLQAEQEIIIDDFQGFIDSPEIQALIAQLSVDVRSQDMVTELDEFINLQNNLHAIDRHAVMIYPLILDDRLELVLVTPFSEPTRYPVEVDRETLNQSIVEFRQALTNPRSQPEAIAHQLYQWLIEPMAADLDAIGAETILYAPDGVLRYIPLAALHDGDQWLTQRFAINHITAASLSDFAIADRSDPKVLAAAFSEGVHEIEVGDRTYPFNGLPFAGQEVANLANLFTDATTLFDTDFSRRLTELAMGSHNIVHLATHATFVQGSPSDSFILFGNGDKVTLEDLKSWEGRFNQVDLFVLSACETGVGGTDLGNGEEILGFGYLMQQAGAKAAIASLWSVSDGGTQVLMNAFYAALNNGYSKTEALQRAQQALITGDETVLAGERGMSIEITDTHTRHPIAQSRSLHHPYYWAPFILIGNGL